MKRSTIEMAVAGALCGAFVIAALLLAAPAFANGNDGCPPGYVKSRGACVWVGQVW